MSKSGDWMIERMNAERTMTRDDVIAAILRIQQLSDECDDPAAHIAEDDLYRNLIQSIADGRCDSPRECAAEALKTAGIKFSRWCE